MPNPYVNKVTANGQTLIDLTTDTAVASDVAQGKYFHLSTGERVQGTASGGGDTYTLTTIVPQQTVTVSDETYTADDITMTSTLVVGDYYIVTLDGTEYVSTCGANWDGETYIGDTALLWYDGSGSTANHTCPFAFERVAWNTGGSLHATSGSHTIKVEHLEFVDGPLNLIAKSVTANGTYNASSDNADGYSSVTVNVSGGGTSMNVQTAQSTTRATSSTYTKLASLTCSKSGTYDVYWDCFRSSTGGTSGSQLYVGGSAYGSANTTFSNHAQTNHLTGVAFAANQEVAVYARSRGSNYYAYCGQLTIVQTA